MAHLANIKSYLSAFFAKMMKRFFPSKTGFFSTTAISSNDSINLLRLASPSLT